MGFNSGFKGLKWLPLCHYCQWD